MDNKIDADIIKISGSIGMVKLEGMKKNIFIFYDDHSNTLYCNNSESVFLYEVFDMIVKNNTNYVILLEEPFVKNYSNIKFLWNETPHIVKFRNFYKKIIKECENTNKNCKVFPIDIRLIICDISIDELVSNINSNEYFVNYKISTWEYFKHILYLFDYIDWNDELFKDSDSNIIFLKKVFTQFKHDKYYMKLKENFDNLYKVYILPDNDNEIKYFIAKHQYMKYNFFSGYPFENTNDKNFLDQYDKLINGLMEFYTYILLSGMNYKNVIIYSGYYHSNNLTYILKKYYNFKVVYSIGNINGIENNDKNDIISNCLMIDKKIFN